MLSFLVQSKIIWSRWKSSDLVSNLSWSKSEFKETKNSMCFITMQSEQGVASVHYLVMHASFSLEWVKWNQVSINYDNLRITYLGSKWWERVSRSLRAKKSKFLFSLDRFSKFLKYFKYFEKRSKLTKKTQISLRLVNALLSPIILGQVKLFSDYYNW